MTFVSINTPPGVVREATPYDVPNVWWDTNNVRWLSGAIMPIGGNTRISAQPLPSKVRSLFQWRDNAAREWTAIGHEAGVQVLFGSLADVTPSSFVSMNAVSGGGYGALNFGTDVSTIYDYSASAKPIASGVVTVTSASPAVVTWSGHGLTIDDVVQFTSTSALPTGITAGQAYYVIPIDANTFKICIANPPGGYNKNGTPINTSSTGTGTITCYHYVGQDTSGRQRSTNPPIFRKPDHWTFASFGQDLLGVCSSDGRLLHLSPTTGVIPLMDVPSNAPTGNYAVAVTAERAVMLMGAGGNPRRVAWSDFENYNGWTFSSTTGQAGYIDLEAASPIITGIRVKEGILVLTQHEVFLVRYVGAPYYYGVEKLGSTTFSSPNAIASGGGQTVWFGEEGFWRYDGGAVRILPCPLFNDIKQNYDPLYGNYRSHMHENGAFPEFWFDYPDVYSSDGECNNYIIWNYSENIWMRGRRARTAAYGAVTATYPIAAGTDNNIYQHEDGWTNSGVSRVGTVWAETSVLDFGARSKIVDVTQALIASDPDIQTTNYQIKLLSKFTPGQTEVTYGPYVPSSSGYTDTRATGRDLRLRIEATADEYWSLGPVSLDIATSTGGGR